MRGGRYAGDIGGSSAGPGELDHIKGVEAALETLHMLVKWSYSVAVLYRDICVTRPS